MNFESTGHALKPLLLTLLLPPVPMLLLCAVAGLLLWRQRRRSGLSCLVIGLAGLWLSCCEGSAYWLTRHVLRAPPSLGSMAIESLHQQSRAKADVAVIVLGAGAQDYKPEYAGPTVRPLTLERLRLGIWLARRMEAPLGFSGGVGWVSKQRLYTEAMVASRVAREEFQMPLRWAEDKSRDTRENARLSLPMLKAAGIHRVVLVTHVQHMPRALANFREAAAELGGLEIIAAPTGHVLDGTSNWQDWCPSGDGLNGVSYVVYEWLAELAGH